MKRPKPDRKEHGVALVITVIVIAVLAVVIVAFTQTATTERVSTRIISDYFQAQLAADSALAMASATIVSNTTNDTFIVVLNEDRQLFIGNGINGSTNYSYVPLFSTVAGVTNPVASITSGVVPVTNVSGGVFFTNNLPGGLSITSPAVSWVYLTNSAGQTNGRFAFWVEDLAAKIDLSVAGTNTSDPAARRPTGTNPAELALWSMFGLANSASASGGAGNDLIAVRSGILTAATARLVSSAVGPDLLEEMAAGLIHDTNEPEMIPYGFSYADEGSPKVNLNANISASGVPAIASIIQRNLPQFGSRGGAMDSGSYITNIAANIVDYADSDSVPTTGPGNFPAWRGIEAIPWPNEIFMQFELISRTNVGANYEFKLGVKHWIEVWNLSSKAISFNAATCAISNDLNVMLSVGGANLWTNLLSQVDNSQKPQWDALASTNVTLAPNSYALLEGPATRTFTFLVPTNASVGTTQLKISPNGVPAKPYTQYSFRIGTVVVDGAPVGRHFGEQNALRVGDFHYIVTPVGFGYMDSSTLNLASTAVNMAGGDPRGQLFCTNEPVMSIKYTNATPNSRNKSLNFSGAANTVDPPKNWPDRGHSSTIDLGASPTGDANSVSTFVGSPKAGNPLHYVQKISDAGSYTFITELANIFDPIRWSDTSNPFYPDDKAAWMLLRSDASVSTANAGCGRNTLRIGRFEHPRFNTNGLRAVQLLDIFGAGPGASTPVANRVAGRININTAGTNALRALAAGVAHASDAALVPGGTNFFVPTNAVSAFVSSVTNLRAQVPFYSPAQLATITTNGIAAQWPTNAVFGNFGTNATNAGDYFGNPNLGDIASPLKEWNDQAAEEWLSRVYPLATVRSRNFVVYCVGQSLQPGSMKPISTCTRGYQVFVNPLRNSQGLTTNCSIINLKTWSL